MKVTLILPCYNGGKKLKEKMPLLFQYLKSIVNYHFDVFVVNDGSTDDTYQQLSSLSDIKLLSYDKNRGKGGAIKYALECIDKCDIVMLMDSDFPFDFKIIKDSLAYFDSYDFVVGSKFHKDSKLLSERKGKRKLASKFCNLIVNSLFRFKLKDTQCGFKVMKYDLAKLLAKKQKIEDWAFDVEYLYIAKLNGYKYIEIPVVCMEDGLSTVRVLKASINFVFSLIKIKSRKKYYKVV